MWSVAFSPVQHTEFLAYVQSCWYVWLSFVICRFSTIPCWPDFLSGSLLPLPLFPVWILFMYNVQYIYSVWGGYRVMLGPYSAGVLHSVMHLTRFRTYKIARLLQTKTLGGRGLQTYRHLPQSRFSVQLYKMTTFCIAFYESYLSMPFTQESEKVKF